MTWWVGLLMVVVGTALGTMAFALTPQRASYDDRWERGLYGIAVAMIGFGAYAMRP